MYFWKNKLILMYSFNILINKETNINMSLVLHSSGLPESLPPTSMLQVVEGVQWQQHISKFHLLNSSTFTGPQDQLRL
jgi:hypothetical protein